MRVLAGTIGALGLAVTVAVAQPPTHERAAVFKAPQAVRPGDQQPVARGVADDFPSAPYLSTTPVARSGQPGRGPGVATGPAWASGVDPNLLPAGGSLAKPGAVRPLTPPPTTFTKDAGPPQPKMLDRFKGVLGGGEKPAAPQPQPQPQPAQPPTASTAFRGTGSNGAPVYAGPPAYRWYGWGSVTPGANPLAPAGQYPRASANWYSITGATPGAFPVPVANPGSVAGGAEPPTYGMARSQPSPYPAGTATAHSPYTHSPYGQPPAIQYTEQRPEPTRPAPPPPSKFMPAASPPTVPVSIPTIPTPPSPKPTPALPAIPGPKLEPVVKLPPLPPVPSVPSVRAPVAAVPPPEPVKPAGPTVSVVPSVEPAKPAAPAVPAEPKPLETAPPTLPPSVTETRPPEMQKWIPTTQPATPPPGTWVPSADATPLPTMTPGEQVGRAPAAPVVARGQVNDRAADPLATLIKQVCQGRADGVEVRYTGTKKLQVCFEIRGATEAQKLVNDISKRPELTAYQIDFCVFVK